MSTEKRKATIRRGAEVFWEEPPAHFGAYSKMLVRPENADTRLIDFRISSYQPKGFVGPHKHVVQEQIYYILEGEGLMEIDGERTVVQPWTVIFLPPGVEHAIYNTGMVDLKFVVVTTPPDDTAPE
ncbi:cupin domain [Ancylobacter aquaticus]|uniref:Cupin domain n=1 Tax=Ancylobacter aquaticus TaxID=100 RepID=A0A4V2PJN5_ANCAQ|nr:cupin domain-containing protein [Ancylobacter aquaticus]TCK29206.1 cupin domain [Ancylobacter aquaticus]